MDVSFKNEDGSSRNTPRILGTVPDVILRENLADELTFRSVSTSRYHRPPDRMSTPSTVLDLGSNIGLTCADYRRLWPNARIVGVEMDSGNLAVAERNADCLILHYAVTDIEGVVHYNPSEFATSFSLEREYSTAEQNVYSHRLSHIISENFGGSVDFVKMDIEGSEWKVLADPGWKGMVKNLLVELHGDNPFFAETYGENVPDNLVAQATKILEGLGFKVERHLPHLQSVFAWR